MTLPPTPQAGVALLVAAGRGFRVLAGHSGSSRPTPVGVIAAALIIVLLYAGSLWLWPFAPCRWCKGSKSNPGSTRRRFGNCPRCGGKGFRVRFGARMVRRAVRRKEK